jgi:diaminopimelate epimerase
MPGERYLEGHHVWVSGYEESNYNIEWMRYEPECTLPEIVKTVPHVAFEVDDVVAAIKGKKVIIQPNSPSEGVLVAFIEENGAPIELIHDKHLHGK